MLFFTTAEGTGVFSHRRHSRHTRHRKVGARERERERERERSHANAKEKKNKQIARTSSCSNSFRIKSSGLGVLSIATSIALSLQ